MVSANNPGSKGIADQFAIKDTDTAKAIGALEKMFTGGTGVNKVQSASKPVTAADVNKYQDNQIILDTASGNLIIRINGVLKKITLGDL